MTVSWQFNNSLSFNDFHGFHGEDYSALATCKIGLERSPAGRPRAAAQQTRRASRRGHGGPRGAPGATSRPDPVLDGPADAPDTGAAPEALGQPQPTDRSGEESLPRHGGHDAGPPEGRERRGQDRPADRPQRWHLAPGEGPGGTRQRSAGRGAGPEIPDRSAGNAAGAGRPLVGSRLGLGRAPGLREAARPRGDLEPASTFPDTGRRPSAGSGR